MPETPEQVPGDVTDWLVEKISGTEQWGIFDDQLVMQAGPYDTPRECLRLIPSFAQAKAFERQHAALAETRRQLAAANATLVQIKVALGQVSTYQGLDVSPVAMLTAALVADHEELEQRIENVLAMPMTVVTGYGPMVIQDEVTRLLRGGSPIPDTLEGLDS